MNLESPKVTVLMPVYNGEEYLREAIWSILNQTFRDFEFLIISEHGTSDESMAIIESYSDVRIRHIHNTTRLGLVQSRNRGLKEARGEYIAWMDADDISLPQRLEKQVEFMDCHPKVGVCGTWVRTFGEQNQTWKYPISYDKIKADSFFKNCFAQSSVMIRVHLFKKFDLHYNENFRYAEDFELWQRCAPCFELVNIAEILVRYRISNTNTSVLINSADRKKAVIQIKKEGFRRFGIKVGNEFHSLDCNTKCLRNIHSYFLKLKEINESVQYCSQENLNEIIRSEWFNICYNLKSCGFWVWKKYWGSPLKKIKIANFKELAIFFVISFIQLFLKKNTKIGRDP
jgi:glycosyltransferase involved in cell wall biosynthesis